MGPGENDDADSKNGEEDDETIAAVNPSEENDSGADGEEDDSHDFDKMQALRILEDMQQQEKDFKKELKEYQKKN